LEFLVRIWVIGFVAITPIILIIGNGPMTSLSQYWNTPYQALFILANAITSYFFFSTPKWRNPSFFLMLTTAFSLEYHPDVHNILATTFFILCLFALYKSNRFQYYFYLFLISMFIMPLNLLYGEIAGILILAAYHAQVLIYKHRLDNRHDNN